MDRDEFTIASATGVEIRLDVAGPGSRAYAFVIDFHIRLILAIAWFIGLALLTVGELAPAKVTNGDRTTTYVFAAVLPALAIYFLYHPVVEVLMRGRSPGKRMASVRVVTTGGATPSVGAILIRNLFRLIDSLPVMYVVGVIATLATARSVRIGDLAAGTVLVHDRARAMDALVALGSLADQTTLEPATLEVARDLLERWKSLEEAHRTILARALLRRIEPGVDRMTLEMMQGSALKERIEARLRGGGAA